MSAWDGIREYWTFDLWVGAGTCHGSFPVYNAFPEHSFYIHMIFDVLLIVDVTCDIALDGVWTAFTKWPVAVTTTDCMACISTYMDGSTRILATVSNVIEQTVSTRLIAR